MGTAHTEGNFHILPDSPTPSLRSEMLAGGAAMLPGGYGQSWREEIKLGQGARMAEPVM